MGVIQLDEWLRFLMTLKVRNVPELVKTPVSNLYYKFGVQIFALEQQQCRLPEPVHAGFMGPNLYLWSTNKAHLLFMWTDLATQFKQAACICANA